MLLNYVLEKHAPVTSLVSDCPRVGEGSRMVLLGELGWCMVGNLGAVWSHPRRIDYTPPCRDMKQFSLCVVGCGEVSTVRSDLYDCLEAFLPF